MAKIKGKQEYVTMNCIKCGRMNMIYNLLEERKCDNPHCKHDLIKREGYTFIASATEGK